MAARPRRVWLPRRTLRERPRGSAPETTQIQGGRTSSGSGAGYMLNGDGRKVVLFLPPYSGKLLGPPLGLLSLASSLREAGYEPRIIDGALHRDYLGMIRQEVQSAVCFGVSLLTGPMIRDAIHASLMVRGLRPELPIVFGGWHPSLRT